MVTVAHELTHALQDQHFDLRKLEKDAAKAHASTPLRTLIEGDAVRIQNVYVQSLPPSDQTAYDEQRASKGAQAQTEIAAKGVPESLTVFFEAPYDLGPTMLTALIAKEDVAGVDALFEHPPTADATFLTPSTLLEHRVFPEVPPPKLAKGERRSGSADVFGAFALYQVLASRVEPGLALAAADAWGGDSMVTFTRGGTTCLRSTFLGKTPDGIATIGDALSQWASQMPAGAAELDRTGERVTLTACDPGAGSTEAPNRALGVTRVRREPRWPVLGTRAAGLPGQGCRVHVRRAGSRPGVPTRARSGGQRSERRTGRRGDQRGAVAGAGDPAGVPVDRDVSAQTTKYFASGWGTMIAEVLCSGSSWNSSVSFMPIRCSSRSSSSLAWSSKSGQAG